MDQVGRPTSDAMQRRINQRREFLRDMEEERRNKSPTNGERDGGYYDRRSTDERRRDRMTTDGYGRQNDYEPRRRQDRMADRYGRQTNNYEPRRSTYDNWRTGRDERDDTKYSLSPPMSPVYGQPSSSETKKKMATCGICNDEMDDEYWRNPPKKLQCGNTYHELCTDFNGCPRCRNGDVDKTSEWQCCDTSVGSELKFQNHYYRKNPTCCSGKPAPST